VTVKELDAAGIPGTITDVSMKDFELRRASRKLTLFLEV